MGKRMNCAGLGLGLALLVATAAGAAETIAPAAMADAETIFKARCVMCHGAAGKGDGPAGAALSPRPRDMTDPAWQKAVTDEHIEAIIAGGGPAVSKSPMMPANPDLKAKPDIIKALRRIVRGFAAAAPAAR
jgi:mono/diheme cytochrome c family protein